MAQRIQIIKSMGNAIQMAITIPKIGILIHDIVIGNLKAAFVIA